ncbi:efflux RND transporter periplasmic adaptor subunit [Butyricimonas virosa]|uniref:efflux RND transporter periplasmic adaptor subunit n=1 Tax=Butyricimonas virosa TaxID=544645 RepID=UPI0024319F17|nr:efflux RND transporter periplasmic adaptor subunit [Butyricimonas virosa]MCI7294382.1 efflux RND transporter periplasmic adaptor subunit [Butyricimonas virosa]MDY6219896.1 efflux RND transporter periplasmic adaptor subunit [Butyricimonas virosa]
MKKIVTIIIAIAVIVGAFFFFRSGDKKVTTYETVELKKGSINNTVTATGTIEPITKVDVGTQVSGTISHIYVDYNSVVTKGQLLAELDRKLLEAELKSEMANLKSSKSEFEYQDKNFKRLYQLHEKNLISETEYEEALYQYEKAQQAYEKAQATLVKAQSNLDYATIYSPIDGVVLSREVEEGQTVAASFETPTMFTIANDLRKMQVIADVDEADIGQVLEGQRVTFTVDAFPDDTFEGDVTQVRLNPTTESNVVTYEVVIDAPNPELKLKPGLTANITVYTMEKNDILLAPLKAFRFTPKTAPENPQTTQAPQAGKGEKVVWLQTAEGIVPKVIKVGVSDGIYTEVKEGIQEGSRLIVGVQRNKKIVPQGGNEESNPFMPPRPGQKKK